jgi:ribosome-binding factor A
MGGSRVEKFERVMLKELSGIFQLKMHDWFEGSFITISKVQSSPDLGVLKIYLSLYDKEKSDQTLAHIDSLKKKIRKELANRIRHVARIVPELIFYKDESLDYVTKMDKLFDQVRRERGEDSN